MLKSLQKGIFQFIDRFNDCLGAKFDHVRRNEESIYYDSVRHFEKNLGDSFVHKGRLIAGATAKTRDGNRVKMFLFLIIFLNVHFKIYKFVHICDLSTKIMLSIS